MSRLNSRVEKLESADKARTPEIWIRVIQRIGQTLDKAKADYIAANGPIPDGANLIVRKILEW